MKKIFLTGKILLLITCFCVFTFAENPPQEILDLVIGFIENPSDLFFNLQQDIEDISPVRDKFFSIRTNLFPTLLPTTLGNLSVKFRVNTEKELLPQLNFSFGYGKIFGFSLLPLEQKPESQNYYAAMYISKTFDNHILYIGLKYSESLLFVKLSQPIELIGEEISEINFRAYDIFYFSGISVFVSEKKSIIAQMCYAPKYKKIVGRLGAEFRNLEFGLDIFPEGLFVFHPYWAYHVRF